jgi:hypothetical protein
MMKHLEAMKYFTPAVKALFPEKWSDYHHNGERQLANELGIREELEEYIIRDTKDDPEMTEELKQILIKLAGPYGKAFLEIIKAQGGFDPKIAWGKPK